MTEWLLSGHNTQETTGIALPVTLTMTEPGLDDQISWSVSQFAGDPSLLDSTLKPTVAIQGRLYLNITYFVRNAGRVLPFDPESLGAPKGLVPEPPKAPFAQRLLLPYRFLKVYRWAARFYRRQLPVVDGELREIYWKLQEESDPLPWVDALFEPNFYARSRVVDRAHVFISLLVTALDSVIRQQAPQLLSLFVGQQTSTSLIGQRIWELAQVARGCGPVVVDMLSRGVTDLEAYRDVPEAAPLVEGVGQFLREYGHRGFRYEADFEAERLADRVEHVLLSIAGQLGETESPEERAALARREALAALRKMNPLQRVFWSRLLRWGQQLISWREDSKSNLALRQAAYGLAARRLARYFYPDQPEDVLMLYTLNEFLDFVRTRGEKRVDIEVLERRRAEQELRRHQSPPPELIWYDPEMGYWRPALEEAPRVVEEAPTRFQGIPASAGDGPVEGIALVTNDPLEAGRRLLAMEGPVILVTRLTDPAWSALFRRLAGVVTELGGVISHAAIVARENGLPAVVGVAEVTRYVRDGQRIRVDGRTGLVEVL